jgi:hypothetical protein
MHNEQPGAATQTHSLFHNIAVATLWLIIAMMIWAAPARNEPLSLSDHVLATRIAAPN